MQELNEYIVKFNQLRGILYTQLKYTQGMIPDKE